MTFDAPNSSPETTDHGTGNNTFTTETQGNIQSLLGLYRLDFDFKRDIENEDIKNILGLWNFGIKDFEENGYSSIWKYSSWEGKQVEMGTGYAIFTDEYMKLRGSYQRMHYTTQGTPIGRTTFRDSTGATHSTQIYFIGPAENYDGTVIGINYNASDIEYALREMLGLNTPEDKRKIVIHA